MPPRPFTIVTVNVRRSNERTHALLQSSTADIVLLQEPWYGTIGTTRSDLDPTGTPTKGLVAYPSLGAAPPPRLSAPSDIPKVATYSRVANRRECVVTNDLSHPSA